MDFEKQLEVFKNENESLRDDNMMYRDDINRLRGMIENLQSVNLNLKKENEELEKIKIEYFKFNKDGKISVDELLKLLTDENEYTIYPLNDRCDSYKILSITNNKHLLTINNCYKDNLYPGLLLTPELSYLNHNYNTIIKNWDYCNFQKNQKKYDFSNKNYKDILDIFKKLSI